MKARALWALLVLANAMAAGFAADPSSVPEKAPSDPEAYAERWRVFVDLDGDGNDDMLLSEAVPLFGKMGGRWSVYLKRDGEFVNVGEIWAHPKALSFEADKLRIAKGFEMKAHARIWVYLRSGGGEGSFGYFRVREREVEGLKSLDIYPGDAGTKLGNALYRATFDESEIPFRLEVSETAEDGAVVWRRADP